MLTNNTQNVSPLLSHKRLGCSFKALPSVIIRLVLLPALVLLCHATPTYASASNVQMLPPLQLGTSTNCVDGSNQLLLFSGDATTDHSAINCAPISADASGGLAASSLTLSPTTTINNATCGTGNSTDVVVGTMRFNPTTNVFEGCDGTQWQPLSPPTQTLLDLGHQRVDSNNYYTLPHTPAKSIVIHVAARGLNQCPKALGIIQYNASGVALTRVLTISAFGSHNDQGSGYISEVEETIPLNAQTTSIRIVDNTFGATNESWGTTCATTIPGNANSPWLWADMDYLVY